jgi:hypothetical protein
MAVDKNEGTPVTDNDKPQLMEGPDADAQYLEVIESMRAAGRPRVRLRIVVQLYRFGKTQRYANWRGILWRLDLEPTVLAGSNFRSALSTFIDAVTKIGPARVIDALQAALKGSANHG